MDNRDICRYINDSQRNRPGSVPARVVSKDENGSWTLELVGGGQITRVYSDEEWEPGVGVTVDLPYNDLQLARISGPSPWAFGETEQVDL